MKKNKRNDLLEKNLAKALTLCDELETELANIISYNEAITKMYNMSQKHLSIAETEIDRLHIIIHYLESKIVDNISES